MRKGKSKMANEKEPVAAKELKNKKRSYNGSEQKEKDR